MATLAVPKQIMFSLIAQKNIGKSHNYNTRVFIVTWYLTGNLFT